MATKTKKNKNNSVVIDLTVAKNTLKTFNVEIKSQQKALDLEYKALQKKENTLWKLQDQARDLKNIVELGTTFSRAVAA